MAFALGMGLGIARTQGVGFSLDAFMAAQADGLYFDFTKTDRFFQENTGPTLADDVGESIGLALESREWNGRTLAEVLAAQTELRGNGSISTVGVATPATYNTANGQGTLNRVDSSNSSGVKITVEAGKYYILDIEKTGGAGTLTIREVSVIATSPGPHPQTRSLYYIKASDSNNGIYISNSVNLTSVDFTLHSIKEVPGKHATQATGSLKPTRQVFYGYSDDQPELVTNGGFDSDATGWTAVNATLSVVSNALRVADNGTFSAAYQGIPTSVGKTYRLTVNRIAASTETNSDIGWGNNIPDGTKYADNERVLSSNGSSTMVFVATATTTYISVGSRVTSYADYDNISVKEVPASRITTAAKGDGSDDNLLTTYTANVQLGSELSSAWTAGTGWVASGNGGTHTAGGGAGYLSSSSFTAAVPGTVYKLTYTVSGASGSGQYQPDIGGAVGAARSTDGTFTDYIKAVTATPLLIFCQSARGITVSNVSVKEVTNQDNFIVAYVNVPTTISSTQIIAGANDASSTNRWFIAVNTSGQLCGGVGGQSVSTILSTATDWRGKSVVVGISCNGTTARLFADNEIVYEAAQSGTPTASTPLRIGSNNAAGTAASFTAATVANVIAGPEYLDLATFLKIRNKLIDP